MLPLSSSLTYVNPFHGSPKGCLGCQLIFVDGERRAGEEGRRRREILYRRRYNPYALCRRALYLLPLSLHGSLSMLFDRSTIPR